ncbi:MAG: sigma 54-interacting transcriptional regulator [Clostridiales Family XIII bacterium]|jgi:arginine utilization regulatory protein|nr:sigma 54-interacting transcriptional regulator [Clostridiales Family XIII bacterium]
MNNDYKDVLIVDENCVITYVYVTNIRSIYLPLDQVVGMKVTDLYENLDEENSGLVKAVRYGESTVDEYQELISPFGDNIYQVYSSYPIMDGDRVVGAIEFSDFKYRLEDIEDIRYHWDKPVYRNNNTRYTLDDIISDDESVKELCGLISNVAKLDSTILITGDTGTGKELVAQSIHNLSGRAGSKFVSQNCGAIPENLIESILFGTVKGGFTGAENKKGILEDAQSGTVFLDEIDALSLELQVKLLQVIEDRKFRKVGDTEEIKLNIRFIAATNGNIEALIEKGRFRADLYYRISAVEFELPRLKDRGNDIELLANHFIDYYNRKLGKDIEHVPADILKIFYDYEWHGNVRELRNVIEGIFNLAQDNKIYQRYLPKRITKAVAASDGSVGDRTPAGLSLKEQMDDAERQLIAASLERNRGNASAAATELGISRQSLRYKMNRLGLINAQA